jgi:hypothetical protein
VNLEGPDACVFRLEVRFCRIGARTELRVARNSGWASEQDKQEGGGATAAPKFFEMFHWEFLSGVTTLAAVKCRSHAHRRPLKTGISSMPSMPHRQQNAVVSAGPELVILRIRDERLCFQPMSRWPVRCRVNCVGVGTHQRTEDLMAKLNWKLLTKKRGSAT